MGVALDPAADDEQGGLGAPCGWKVEEVMAWFTNNILGASASGNIVL